MTFDDRHFHAIGRVTLPQYTDISMRLLYIRLPSQCRLMKIRVLRFSMPAINA